MVDRNRSAARIPCAGGLVGDVLELGSGVPITILALGLVLGLRALLGPIVKLEGPTSDLSCICAGVRMTNEGGGGLFDWLARLANLSLLANQLKSL